MVLAALRSADSKGVHMAHAARREQDEGAGRVINSVAKAEKRAIEAVRDFVETVNRALLTLVRTAVLVSRSLTQPSR
jgi:hypothetical protein